MKLITKIKDKPLLAKIVLFCLTGGIATLIDLAFFNLFYLLTSIFVLSRIFGILISIIFNFSFNRNITFKAKGIKLQKQIPKYVIIYALSMFSNVLVGKLVLSLLSDSVLSANIAALAGLAVSIPISFLGSLFWVFKKK